MTSWWVRNRWILLHTLEVVQPSAAAICTCERPECIRARILRSSLFRSRGGAPRRDFRCIADRPPRALRWGEGGLLVPAVATGGADGHGPPWSIAMDLSPPSAMPSPRRVHCGGRDGPASPVVSVAPPSPSWSIRDGPPGPSVIAVIALDGPHDGPAAPGALADATSLVRRASSKQGAQEGPEASGFESPRLTS